MAFTIWRRARLNALGILILVMGIGTGSLLYWLAGRSDMSSDDDVLAEQQQSKAYQAQMERNVGAVGALLAGWSDTLAEFGEPKGIAVTTMVVSCAAAGGSFWVASRQRG